MTGVAGVTLCSVPKVFVFIDPAYMSVPGRVGTASFSSVSFLDWKQLSRHFTLVKESTLYF